MTPTFEPSPLSPERALAMRSSRTFKSGSSAREHADARAHQVLAHERGPEADDLGRLRASAREARHSRRAARDERDELHPEAVDLAAIGALHAEAQHDLHGIGRLAAADAGVTRAGAHVLLDALLGAVVEAVVGQALPHDARAQARLV